MVLPDVGSYSQRSDPSLDGRKNTATALLLFLSLKALPLNVLAHHQQFYTGDPYELYAAQRK
jgi:hypothetical protein